MHTNSIPFNEIVGIARIMHTKSLAKTLQGCVLEMLGTCRSVGCSVDGAPPQDIIAAIRAGDMQVPEA